MANPTRIAAGSSGEELIRQQIFQAAQAAAPEQTEKRISAEALKAAAQAEQQEDPPLNPEEQDALRQAIQQLDKLVKPLSIGLSVQYMETIKRNYVQLLDRETGETIREIPPRKILELKENIKAFQGLLFDKFS